MKADHRDVRWYAYCVRFQEIPADMRRRVSRQTAAHYRRIAHLPRDVGLALDALKAPLYVIRWVAWGEPRSLIDFRHWQVTRFHERAGRWPPDQILAGWVPFGTVIQHMGLKIDGVKDRKGPRSA